MLASRRQIEGLVLRRLSRLGVPPHRLPRSKRPVLFGEVMEQSLHRADAMEAIRRIVPWVDDVRDEFVAFWRDELVPVATPAHDHGNFAGGGPVDFAEALTVYGLIRGLRPERVLELGYASGVSSWVWATALERNGNGVLHTVDVKDFADNIAPFHRLMDEGRIRPYVEDGVAFVERLEGTYDLTFSDALHTYAFNLRLARALRAKAPDAIHCYHEWSLAPHASSAEAKYVSMRVNLGSCGERRAFEETFTEGYVHAGVPSSSGLGLVIPAAAMPLVGRTT
jgi:hypothetical protein